MSYSFGMFFSQTESLEAAMVKAKKTVDLFARTPNADKAFIKDNLYHTPSLFYDGVGRTIERNSDTFKDIADRGWLFRLFNFNFVYWPKQQLHRIGDAVSVAATKRLGHQPLQEMQ